MYLPRTLDNTLAEWATTPNPRTLLVYGPPRVGKHAAVAALARTKFKEIISVDLTKDDALTRFFRAHPNPATFLPGLSLAAKRNLVPGTCVVVIDTVLHDSEFLQSLPLLVSENSSLHVVVIAHREDVAPLPLHRMNYLAVEVGPFLFSEFVAVAGRTDLAEILRGHPHEISVAQHDAIVRELTTFMKVGGMPEAVTAYLKRRDVRDVLPVLKEITAAVAPKKTDVVVVPQYLGKKLQFQPRFPVSRSCEMVVYGAVATQPGEPLRYHDIRTEFSLSDVKHAHDLLCDRGVLRKVSPRYPRELGETGSVRRAPFKTLALDVGVLGTILGIKPDDLDNGSILEVAGGILAEQFVAQELAMAQRKSLEYWTSRVVESEARVDFLTERKNHCCPVIINRGNSALLEQYIDTCLATYGECDEGVVLTATPFRDESKGKKRYLPLYWTHAAFKLDATPRRWI